MRRSSFGGTFLIFTATLIWGIGVVALRAGMNYMGPFTLTAFRFLLGGAAALGPALYYAKKRNTVPQKQRASMLKVGVICGLILCLSVSLRQFGLYHSAVGRVSFITSLYVIVVPMAGLFFGRKIPKAVVIGIIISVVGMYFLGFSGGMTFNIGDIFALAAAFSFAAHILLIDRFARNYDTLTLVCIQAFMVGSITLVLAFIFESPQISSLINGLGYILYAGIMSSFVAHMLQIRAQRSTDPAVASILFSMEAVFATIVSWIALHEHLSPREILGCALLLTAVIVSKSPLSLLKNRKRNE